ncbi:MAG TPA: hypothetical protein VGV67_08070 [Solirubrobacteraceae bacterium]|nr:hypothetical protein [Solirubrobacteraceae bacterium]
MGRVLAVLLVVATALAAVAVAQERRDDGSPRVSGAQTPDGLPAPNVALSRDPVRLAQTLTATIRRLREALRSWDGAGAVPHDVTYLALHHQRILRLTTTRRALGDATLARLPRDVRGEAAGDAVLLGAGVTQDDGGAHDGLLQELLMSSTAWRDGFAIPSVRLPETAP